MMIENKKKSICKGCGKSETVSEVAVFGVLASCLSDVISECPAACVNSLLAMNEWQDIDYWTLYSQSRGWYI